MSYLFLLLLLGQLFINTLSLFEIKIRINFKLEFEIHFVQHIEVMTHFCISIIYNSTTGFISEMLFSP